MLLKIALREELEPRRGEGEGAARRAETVRREGWGGDTVVVGVGMAAAR